MPLRKSMERMPPGNARKRKIGRFVKGSIVAGAITGAVALGYFGTQRIFSAQEQKLLRQKTHTIELINYGDSLSVQRFFPLTKTEIDSVKAFERKVNSLPELKNNPTDLFGILRALDGNRLGKVYADEVKIKRNQLILRKSSLQSEYNTTFAQEKKARQNNDKKEINYWLKRRNELAELIAGTEGEFNRLHRLEFVVLEAAKIPSMVEINEKLKGENRIDRDKRQVRLDLFLYTLKEN